MEMLYSILGILVAVVLGIFILKKLGGLIKFVLVLAILAGLAYFLYEMGALDWVTQLIV